MLRGRKRIERREKWPKKSWEEGEIRGKGREEGEKEKLGELNWMDLDEETKSREGGEIGSESREKGDLLPCSSPLHVTFNKRSFACRLQYNNNSNSYFLPRVNRFEFDS